MHRTIYEQLARAVLEEHRVHYHQRVDEIAPSIRYCAYNIGDMPSDIKELTKLRVSMPGYELLASKIDVSSFWGHLCVCVITCSAMSPNTSSPVSQMWWKVS